MNSFQCRRGIIITYDTHYLHRALLVAQLRIIFIIQMSESFFRGKIDRYHFNFLFCLRVDNSVLTHVRDPRAYTRSFGGIYVACGCPLGFIYILRIVTLRGMFMSLFFQNFGENRE